jgi:hypothetical protein
MVAAVVAGMPEIHAPGSCIREGRAAAGLCEFAEVEGGLVAVGEADDHAGGAAMAWR